MDLRHYQIDQIQDEEITNSDTVIIADIEHQSNPTLNLLNLSKIINDDAKIIVLSKNMIWMILLKMLKKRRLQNFSRQFLMLLSYLKYLT